MFRNGAWCGGAEGIRTPDLLIANETRYQLRHSPVGGGLTRHRVGKDITWLAAGRIGSGTDGSTLLVREGCLAGLGGTRLLDERRVGLVTA